MTRPKSSPDESGRRRSPLARGPAAIIALATLVSAVAPTLSVLGALGPGLAAVVILVGLLMTAVTTALHLTWPQESGHRMQVWRLLLRGASRGSPGESQDDE